MGYEWEDLDDAQFERVVVELARELFGLGVQSFATGKDGGRDARYEGTAQAFPSSSAAWTGVTVFQAKHTNGTNTHFSDPTFSGDKKDSVLSEELPRIKKLHDAGSVDNYFLVANRRLGAITHEALKQRISEGSGLTAAKIFLAGTEYLDEMLHRFPEILSRARVDPLAGPLLVSSADLAEVILALAREFDLTASPADAPVVDRVSFDDKNRINGMTETFANALLRRYLAFTRQIEDFLANPGNSELREMYQSAVDDFQLKLIAHHQEGQPFDNVFNYLFDLLVHRDGVLARNRRLTRAMLFYMYWHCDIGRTSDADS